MDEQQPFPADRLEPARRDGDRLEPARREACPHRVTVETPDGPREVRCILRAGHWFPGHIITGV